MSSSAPSKSSTEHGADPRSSRPCSYDRTVLGGSDASPGAVGGGDALPGTSPLGRISASIGSGLETLVLRRGFWVGMWTAAIVAELLALRPVLFDHEGPIVGLDVVFSLVGGSFAAFGLVAWRRRPDSRSGALMTATGFAFFASPLFSQLDGAVMHTAVILLVDVWIFFFVLLILTLLTRAAPALRGSTAGSSRSTRCRSVILAADLAAVPRRPGKPAEHVPRRRRRARHRPGSAHACSCASVPRRRSWWPSAGRWSSPPRRRALLPSLAGGLVLALFSRPAGKRPASPVRGRSRSSGSRPARWSRCRRHSWPDSCARGSPAAASRSCSSASGRRAAADLQAALAKTLGDPELVVARWMPEDAAYVDADGRAGQPARERRPAGRARRIRGAAASRRSSTTRRSTRIRS